MAGLLSRFSGLAIGAVIVGSLMAGGCAEQKEKQAALMDENTKLRANDEAMKQQVQASDAAARQAQAEKDQALAQLAQKNNQPPVMQDPPRGPGKKSGGGSSEADRRITVAGDVLFSPGQATLTPGGKKELDKVAANIKSQYSGHHIRVEGFTDSDPITKSKWSSNEELSSARAVAVEKYLSAKGVSKSRIEAVGMGAAQPKATKKDSRRVEIVIVGN